MTQALSPWQLGIGFFSPCGGASNWNSSKNFIPMYPKSCVIFRLWCCSVDLQASHRFCLEHESIFGGKGKGKEWFAPHVKQTRTWPSAHLHIGDQALQTANQVLLLKKKKTPLFGLFGGFFAHVPPWCWFFSWWEPHQALPVLSTSSAAWQEKAVNHIREMGLEKGFFSQAPGGL